MSKAGESGEAALLGFLVRAGLVPVEVVPAAEAELSQQHSGSLIDWLVRRGVTDEREVAEALAKGLRLPFVDLAAFALDPVVTALVREELASQHQIVPLRADEQRLTIAMTNPLDRGASRAIEFATGKRVQVEVATQSAVRDALDHAYHLDESLDEYLKGVSEGGDLSTELKEQGSPDIRGLMRETNLAPVVKLLNSILMEALRIRASDIHVEAAASGLRVRYRVDGLLQESLRLPKWVQDPLIARCKVLARLDITERRVPQDGRIQIGYRDATIDLRVSCLPTQFGEKVTMRVLDKSGTPSGLAGFSLSERDLRCIRHAIARPEGMVLVTGPTGSGKTTTLYGMIAELVSPTRNIVTIENPIEYQIDGINQVEINEKQGLTFAGTLRSILRQDPDVILVGEIRDSETAEIAVRAAQTGHLVLSTLHTNDAVATIARLFDLGIEPYLLAASLHLIVAQRLVRRVCEHCAEPHQPDRDALAALQIEGAENKFRRGRGCNSCHKSGTAGRVGVFEVMAVTQPLAKLIEAKAPDMALRAQARADGTTLLAAHAAAQVCAGIATIEEVLRVVDIGSSPRCPACARAVEQSFTVCPHCAAVLQRKCPSCGMRVESEWRVCPYCGSLATPSVSAVAPIARETASASPIQRQSAELREYRALIVDDHPDIRRLITIALEHGGLPISTMVAASGAEALELVATETPDLILLDIMMPGMDGFEVCQRLRASVRTAFIPILMLTARDDTESRARGFLVGTDDYVGKPFAPSELNARVRRLLERTYGVSLPTPKALGASLPNLRSGGSPADVATLLS